MERVLIIPDLHFPEHDPKALAVALAAARAIKPDRTVVLGDFLDCAQFSGHPPKCIEEARTTSWADDLAGAGSVLDKLLACTKGELAFVEGNHEKRISKWAANSVAGRAVHDLVAPSVVFGRKKRLRYIKHGPRAHYKVAPNLLAVHGWSVGAGALRKHLQLSKSYSVVFGHVHRCGLETDRDLDDRVIEAWSPGFLAKHQPYWLESNPSGWTQGVGLVYVNGQRHQSFPIPIDGYQCVLPSGKLIRL